MPVWVWARLFLALSVGGLMLIGLAALGCVLSPKVAASQHWRVPPGASETLGTLAAMTADPGLRLTALGVFLSLPLLFFGFCLPFHAAWNRRARRLSAAARSQAEDAGREEGVWPPAPLERPHPSRTSPPSP